MVSRLETFVFKFERIYMQAFKIGKKMALFTVFLFIFISSGCASNRRVQTLEREVRQLRAVVEQIGKQAEASAIQNANKAEAAASRAENAASKAESAAAQAESSAELITIFMDEGRKDRNR